MKGWIMLKAADDATISEAQVSLLGDTERKVKHAGGVNIRGELERVGLMDKLTLMSALGSALEMDKDEWTLLFMMKAGIGPLEEKTVVVNAPPTWLHDNPNKED